MPLTHKQSRKYLDFVLANILELNSDSPIWKNLTHNDYENIEEIVTINEEDILDIHYPEDNNSL